MNVEEGLQIENRTLCFILEKMYLCFMFLYILRKLLMLAESRFG